MQGALHRPERRLRASGDAHPGFVDALVDPPAYLIRQTVDHLSTRPVPHARRVSPVEEAVVAGDVLAVGALVEIVELAFSKHRQRPAEDLSSGPVVDSQLA